MSATDVSPTAPPPQKRPGPLARTRARFGAGGLDLRNTWQILAGAVLLPLGIAVIVLGWNGAAHGRVDQQQIPYLISGGVLGLAAVIVGCFFFWAHWLYRIYDQADLHHQAALREQAELLRELIDAVERLAAAGPPAAAEHNGASLAVPAARTFVATPTGTNFHLPSCPIVASRTGSLRDVSAEQAAALRPCRICEPLERCAPDGAP